MKYVAFLDILGFKSTLDKMDQKAAQNFIMRFSKTIFQVFQSFEKKKKIIRLHIIDVERFLLQSLLQQYCHLP